MAVTPDSRGLNGIIIFKVHHCKTHHFWKSIGTVTITTFTLSDYISCHFTSALQEEHVCVRARACVLSTWYIWGFVFSSTGEDLRCCYEGKHPGTCRNASLALLGPGRCAQTTRQCVAAEISANIESMLFQSYATVCDGSPVLKQH